MRELDSSCIIAEASVDFRMLGTQNHDGHSRFSPEIRVGRRGEEGRFVHSLLAEIRKTVIDQDRLVERTHVGLLADGHVLLEGVPGPAKTLLVKTLATQARTRTRNLTSSTKSVHSISQSRKTTQTSWRSSRAPRTRHELKRDHIRQLGALVWATRWDSTEMACGILGGSLCSAG